DGDRGTHPDLDAGGRAGPQTDTEDHARPVVRRAGEAESEPRVAQYRRANRPRTELRTRRAGRLRTRAAAPLHVRIDGDASVLLRPQRHPAAALELVDADVLVLG